MISNRMLGTRDQSIARAKGAFSLIEIIGVLAVISILALVLIPSVVRQMDRMAGDKESASLRVITDAFQASVLRNRYVPAANEWATNVARELGLNISDVATNSRRQPRYFLIEHDLQIGAVTASTLPYQQTGAGVPSRPANARFMVVSSIGQPLPSLPAVPSEADFNAIWNWNDASSTGPTNATILGSFSRGEDLKVQRLNAGNLFVSLWLTVYASSKTPRYSIDSASLGGTVPVVGTNAYFIQNSVLSLGSQDTALSLDSQQVLIRDNSFVFNGNIWRGSIAGGKLVNGLDVASVVDQYLKAPANPNAQNTNQQALVLQAMQDYMDAYVAWSAGTGGNFDKGPLQTAAKDKEATLRNLVQGQYLSPANSPPTPLGVPCTP